MGAGSTSRRARSPTLRLDGRAKTALLLASIAGFESSYRADVDDGRKRGKAGDACIMQIIVPRGKLLHLVGTEYEWSHEEGWTTDDLIADRTKCVRAALHLVRESLKICRNLSLYTIGRCDSTEPKAKHRWERPRVHYVKHPAAATDVDVLGEELLATRARR